MTTPSPELVALARALPALRVKCRRYSTSRFTHVGLTPASLMAGSPVGSVERYTCPRCEGRGWFPNPDLEAALAALEADHAEVSVHNYAPDRPWTNAPWFAAVRAGAHTKVIAATEWAYGEADSPALALQRAACQALGLDVKEGEEEQGNGS